MQPTRMRSIDQSSESSLPSRQPKNYEKYLQRKRELRKADEIVKRMEDNLRKFCRDEEESQEDIEERLKERVQKQDRELVMERNKNAQLQKALERLKEQLLVKQTEDTQTLKSALQKKTEECILLNSKVQKLLANNIRLEQALKYQLQLLDQLPTTTN